MELKKLQEKNYTILIWGQPISKLSTKFKMEPQKLKDICGEKKIPLPARGHWSKVRFNKEVVKPPLPKIEHNNSQINIDPSPKARKFRTDYHRRAYELEQRKDLKFKVPKRISNYHPLVRASKNALGKY